MYKKCFNIPFKYAINPSINIYSYCTIKQSEKPLLLIRKREKGNDKKGRKSKKERKTKIKRVYDFTS